MQWLLEWLIKFGRFVDVSAASAQSFNIQMKFYDSL